MASALDDLLADFASNAGTMPAVNPPEASQVLAAATAPEVAGAPEPEAAAEPPPAPTEKPAEVRAAEAARTRKPRATKATEPKPITDAIPAAVTQPVADGMADVSLVDMPTERLVRTLQDRGYVVQLTAAG